MNSGKLLCILPVLAALLTGACYADRTPDDEVITAVSEQSVTEPADGVAIRELWFTDNNDAQQHVFIMTVDMDKNTLALGTPGNDADNDGGDGAGARLGEIAEAAWNDGVPVVAAVNGDFYKTASDGGEEYAMYSLLGTMIKDGEWISDGAQNEGAMYFGVTADGETVMGTADGAGDWDAVKNELETAVGGELWLIRDGESNVENVTWRTTSDTLVARYGANGAATDELGAVYEDSQSLTRAARTCIGVTADGDIVILVADNESSGVGPSAEVITPGLDIVQMTKLMLDEGCVQMMNLDGGGSSMIGVIDDDGAFALLNTPRVQAETGGRAIGEGLLIVSHTNAEDASGSGLPVYGEEGHYYILASDLLEAFGL